MSSSSDMLQKIQNSSDAIRVTVVTHTNQLDGDLHCPRVGKPGRRLSNMLNNKEANFLALTNVQISNQTTGFVDPKIYPLIQVALASIEYISPALDAQEIVEEGL